MKKDNNFKYIPIGTGYFVGKYHGKLSQAVEMNEETGQVFSRVILTKPVNVQKDENIVLRPMPIGKTVRRKAKKIGKTYFI